MFSLANVTVMALAGLVAATGLHAGGFPLITEQEVFLSALVGAAVAVYHVGFMRGFGRGERSSRNPTK